jgi:hypothetical protein
MKYEDQDFLPRYLMRDIGIIINRDSEGGIYTWK